MFSFCICIALSSYSHSTVVDTIVCMDGTEIIGGYLAEELMHAGIMSMNQHNTIYVIAPEMNGSGQVIFRDNLKMMIEKRKGPSFRINFHTQY